jgi:microcin C transport system substrate-binding protein
MFGQLSRKLRDTFAVVLAAGLLVACGGSEEEVSTGDITQEVNDYYAAHPELFQFKTPADLPADLSWENGMELPDLGSPEATKGGTEYSFVQDLPRTLRYVGPDTNGAFRRYLLDDVTLPLAVMHPDRAFEFFPGIAAEWAVDEDSATVYAKLDPDARWSDGEPVTAQLAALRGLVAAARFKVGRALVSLGQAAAGVEAQSPSFGRATFKPGSIMRLEFQAQQVSGNQ